MSEYKMYQDQLRSYFKSVCNSFYIAYDQVKRLEKEENILENGYHGEDLKTVKGLLEIESRVVLPNKYVTLKYSREELLEEKKRLEAEEQEYERKSEELEKIRKSWADKMWADYEAIKSVIYEIARNKFSIIVTTKEEVYALMCFYYDHLVKDYPVVNMKEEHIQAFPTGEEMYDDFLFAYKEALDDYVLQNAMELLYYKYF